MKKLLSLALALSMCLGLAIPALAAENNSSIPKYGRDPNSYYYASKTAFVTDGTYFYYVVKGEVNNQTGKALPDKIIKQSNDGKTKTVIFTAAYALPYEIAALDRPSFNLLDGYLYFKDTADNVYRLPIDGGFATCIYKRDTARTDYNQYIQQMIVIDGRLYISWLDNKTHQNNLISMRLDGSDVQIVNEVQSSFIADGQWIYFCGEGENIGYNIRTGERSTYDTRNSVYSGKPFFIGVSNDGRFHYMDIAFVFEVQNFQRLGHYSTMPDGTDLRKEKDLQGDLFSCTIVGNDYLYYANDGYIYKSSLYTADTPVKVTNKPAEKGIGCDFGYHNGYVYVYGLGFYKVPGQAPAPTPEAKLPTAFNDVTAGAYYVDAVIWAVEKNVTSGTSATTFSPDATCTTAQILTFLWRANGSPAPAIQNPFSDVSASDYYAKAARWAYEQGLVSGDTFAGSTPCTRSMTVTYLWKLAGSPSTGASSFTDVPGAADYAQAVAWAVGKGITSGTGATTFSPDTTCSRGQIVTFLYRAYQ